MEQEKPAEPTKLVVELDEDEGCIKHIMCNCFELVDVERRWEFTLIMTAIVILTIAWFFALMTVPTSDTSGGALAVWMAWLIGFTLLALLALLVVRSSVEHKIKYKRFRDPTRNPLSRMLE